MNILAIIGWVFLLSAWFPKSFMKDEQLRRGINIALAGIALGFFISGGILQLIK